MRKFVLYVLGILILALGVVFTIQSKLGTSPYDALLVGLFKTVGLTVGSWEVIISVIMLICNALLTKQRPEFLGLLTSFITGVGIDTWLFLLQPIIQPEIWVAKLACFAIGIIFIGLGTAIYLYTKFAPIPFDHLTLIIHELTNRSIQFSRTLIYFILLLSAIVFHGPIGIGTILTLFLGGASLNFFIKIIEKLANKPHLSQPCTQAKN